MARPVTLNLYRSGSDLQSGAGSNNLIVSGSGFGTKPQQSTPIYERFLGAENQLLYDLDNAWAKYGANNVGGKIVSTNPPYTNCKSVYNDWTRGEFSTNYKSFTPARSVFCSYLARTVGCAANDTGVIKWTRITSTAASGGGGVYNGPGVHTLTSMSPVGDSPYSAMTDSGNNFFNLGYQTFPVNTWVRHTMEIYLSDAGVANGFFKNIVDGHSSNVDTGLTQRLAGSALLLDNVLLGLEMANARQWQTITVQNSATYTVTYNSTPVNYTSDSSATAAEIASGMAAALTAAGATVFTNAANEICVTSGTSVVYDNKFTPRAYGMQIADLYLDTSLARFELGNANTYAASTIKETQRYTAWSDTQVTLQKNKGRISGSAWLYFIDAGGTATSYGQV